MRKQSIEMAIVETCSATQCAYNEQGSCHARAITVGDGDHPACDTYFPRTQHVPGQTPAAGVGACKVSGCAHNADLECTADLVRIGHHAGHADCQTYSRRV